ncbi:MAG: exodeoxyribonuclease VII small subunit [Clostridia bacterium]|nr:exodeoxyribonuclease VII small subunit [Clostridia bacterium]
MSTNEKKNEVSFEQSLARLEEIVKALESGNVPLEDLIKLYEEGTALVKACSEILNAAEEKVKILRPDGEGITEEDFGTV